MHSREMVVEDDEDEADEEVSTTLFERYCVVGAPLPLEPAAETATLWAARRPGARIGRSKLDARRMFWLREQTGLDEKESRRRTYSRRALEEKKSNLRKSNL